MEAEEERIARQARRVLWGFRLAFYPAAAAVAAVLLLSRGDADSETPTVVNGTTTQGKAFTLHFDGDGRATYFDTVLVTTCPNGDPWLLRWFPADGDPVPFRRDGSRLRVSERWTERYPSGVVGRRRYTLDAQLGEGVASGVLSVVERVQATAGAAYECVSGNVSFTARL